MKKRQKLLLIMIVIIISVFAVYQLSHTNKLSYIALGDSLAEGQNPYGEISYGYADYIADYLRQNKKLKNYTKKYSQNDYKTIDIINQLEVDTEIRKDLRESDIVTVSIGANDFLNRIKKTDLDVREIKNYQEIVNNIIPGVDLCLKEVRKYAKEKLIIVGYYNPIPFLFNTSEKELDELFSYIDDQYQQLAMKYHATYISNYQLFKENKDFLPNPKDIHPNIEGYQAIATKVLEVIIKEQR